jgi:hypothetical protein
VNISVVFLRTRWSFSMSPKIVIQAADAISFPCDVLILKYAQNLYGLDAAVFNILASGKEPIKYFLPDIGSCTVFNTKGKLSPNRVMFIPAVPTNRYSKEESML